jgi:hypothetical protein
MTGQRGMTKRKVREVTRYNRLLVGMLEFRPLVRM